MSKSILLFFLVVLAGCSTLRETPPSPSALPTLEIAAETLVPTATQTATSTNIPPTQTSTDPPTDAPTQTPLPPPTSTPYPAPAYLNDQWQQIDIPNALVNGLDSNWVAFINYNDRPTQPTSEESVSLQQTLYLQHPSAQRIRIADIPASTGDRVFWSPAGTHAVYFVESDFDDSGNPIGGLYMLDLVVGLNYRLFDIDNLNPRGIAGHVPVWSADGSRLAVVLPTEYATDIFMMNADGSNFRNLTNSGSYDLYPAFSPDGLWLAFVSDRVGCPTWIPGEPETCNRPDAAPPTAGNLHLLNLNTGEIRKVTDVLLNGAPRWITPTKLAFSTGGGSALAETSEIWLIDIEAGTAVRVSAPETFSVSDHWTEDAIRVLYQRAGTTTELVLADSLGREIAVSGEYIFPRFGVTADWSPSGEYLAIAGRNGQCPYGLLVVDPDFEVLTAPARNLLACDPVYAPGGRYMAFMGIRPSTISDGRLDIYVANLNGLGAINITSDLQGQMELLGWVGPTPERAEE